MSIRLSDFVNQTTDINTEEETPKALRLGDYVSLQREPEAPIKDSLVDITPDQYEDWHSRGKIGFIEQLRRQDKTEMLPFNPEGAFKSMRLLMAVNRLRKNEAPMEQLEKDRDLVGNYLMKSEEERVRGYDVGGAVVRNVAELPAFMIEFLATGGLASVGKAAVRKGTSGIARKIVQSQILKATTRTVGGVAGATARTIGMPQRYVRGFADRQLNNNFELTDKGLELAEEVKEKPRVSALKAFGDVLIENFSEVSGPTLSRAVKSIIPKGLKTGLEKIFVRLKPNETVRKLWTKAGYNGFLEEMGEERVGNFIRALTGVEDFGAEDPDSVFDRIISSIPNAEELLVEALVLSVPGAGNVALSQIVNAIQSRRKAAKVKDSPLHEITDQEADDIVQSGQEQEQPETEVVEPEAEGAKPATGEVAAEQKPKIKEDPILNHFKGQLIEAGFDETDATEQASLIQTGINTLAKKAGVDPRSILERYGVTIQKRESPEGQPTIQKPVRYDNQGLPIRRPRSVVVTVPTPEGRQAKITHQMILDEADALFNEASELRASSTTDVEKFVIGNGGLKAFVRDETGRVPESEEMRTVPLRFKNRQGLPADEMAQMAFDAGVISEPSADLLREELKRLPIRGDVPVLADFYDEAQRNLEEYFSTFKGEPMEMAAQPALYQSSLINFPSENIGDRYQRLRYQALSQGMNPIQASKWAKEQLKTQPLPTETGQKQGEFSIPGGVKGFGQGKQGEGELFQGPPQKQPQPSGSGRPAQGNPLADVQDAVFPATEISSQESIGSHPDFVKVSFDATAVVNKYATERGIVPSYQLAHDLWSEFHVLLTPLKDGSIPLEKRQEMQANIEAKYPDIRNEFIALNFKINSDVMDTYFDRWVKGKYGVKRPKAALEAEQQSKVPQTETPAFKKWFGDSKVVDEQNQPKRVYRGDFRVDIVGARFKKSKTTSSRFYFTEDPEVASSYATGKQFIEETDYSQWYKIGEGKKKYDLREAWWRLTPEQREGVKRVMMTTETNDQGEFETVKPSIDAEGKWRFDYMVRENHGNWLMVAKDKWLDSAALYDQEERFGELLKKAGINDFEYVNPHVGRPGVYPVYLSIKNPLDASNVPAEFVNAVREWANKTRIKARQHGEDMWDKSLRDPKSYADELEKDAKEHSNLWTTSIPDPVIKIAEQLGYDGIVDRGGKYGGVENKQWIAFEPTQIKSAIGNRGTFDPKNPNILFQDKETPRGSIEFKQGQTFISLFENADKSTFLHETGHFYLRLLGDLTKESTASQDLKKDASTILKWLGAESFESITVEQNEKFARGFEAYLMEGKAPTSELKSAFERFKEWLTEIYKSVKALNVQLSPEVRDVYARMLGAEAVAEKPGEKKREPMISGPEIVRGRMNRLVTEEESISRELEAVQSEKSALEEAGKKTDIADAKIKRLTDKYNELDSELAELIKAREEDIKLGREEVQLTASEIRRIERSSKAAGRLIGKGQVKSAKEILDRRRAFIRGMRDQYQIDDADMKRLMRRDIRLMTNYEFKKFLDDIEAFASQLQAKRDLKLSILSEINEKELKKVENLRQFLKFPTLDKMSVEQLNKFNQELEATQKGDEFLSVRKLETVKNTDLAGIKTVREAMEILAKKMGVPVESLGNMESTDLDKLRFDTALADKNPFYKFLVDETNTSLLEGEQKFLEYEKEIDDLVRKARASRETGFTGKLVPTDNIVFDWMEATAEEKPKIAEKMTDAEIDLANYMQARFAQFRDYLIQQGTLEKYQENYITHIRRGFFETWKEDGFMSAFKEVFAQYKEDAAVFKIMEDDTENILPMEKFFAYAMRRTGEIKPSKNVSRAFKTYTRAMLKKQALDKIVPALDIYAYSLSPKQMTPRGLQMNRTLIKFVREWINNKKGRRSSLGGILPQGGAVDIGLRAIDGFITMLDLGLNIPVSVSATIGEQVVNFVGLGSAKYAKGLVRMNMAKGKKIVNKNRDLVGKSLWDELTNTANSLGDTFSNGLFSLFSLSYTNANKIHLLGSMTDEEWKAGDISSKRKAEIKREIGRWRHVQGSSSIAGSTSAGKVLTKYKSWALPILRTVLNDIGKITKMSSEGKFGEAIKSREFHELLRATLTTSLFALAGRALIGDDDDDDSFIGQIIKKAYRESLSVLGAIDPTVLSTVRLLSLLGDLSSSIKQIVMLEEYKTKSGYKGVDKLIRTLTPRAVKQLSPEEKTSRL